MAYIGDRLEPVFQQDPGPVMRLIAERAGASIEAHATRNTPIGPASVSLGGPSEQHAPGRLRAGWYRLPVSRRRGPGGGYESRVRNDVDYAVYVEEGTGLYGPRHAKYPIDPKKPGGYLRWFSGGRWVFARHVEHPGSPGQHMLAIAVAITDHELPTIAEPIIATWFREIERTAS